MLGSTSYQFLPDAQVKMDGETRRFSMSEPLAFDQLMKMIRERFEKASSEVRRFANLLSLFHQMRLCSSRSNSATRILTLTSSSFRPMRVRRSKCRFCVTTFNYQTPPQQFGVRSHVPNSIFALHRAERGSSDCSNGRKCAATRRARDYGFVCIIPMRLGHREKL